MNKQEQLRDALKGKGYQVEMFNYGTAVGACLEANGERKAFMTPWLSRHSSADKYRAFWDRSIPELVEDFERAFGEAKPK